MSQQLDKEPKIKRFPFLGTSSNLIEYFLIIGYESTYIEHKIKDDIIKETIPKYIKDNSSDSNTDNNLIYTPQKLPVLLNSISSDFSGTMIGENEIIKFSFPNPPPVYVIINEKEKINIKRIVFYINNETFQGGYKRMTHGFTYIFYETKTIKTDNNKKEYKILIPKAFTFISQYPLFNTFDNIATQLIKYFTNLKKIEIPLEILIYNIVNFIPCPMNVPLNIQFFPSSNISTYAQNIINITQKQKKELQEEFMRSKLNNRSFDLNDSNYNTLQLFVKLQTETPNKIKLNQLNIYPYYDYNLVEIFRVLPLNTLIRVFILSFLDQELLIFSQNIEILNLTLYILSSLNYPFTDSMYFWHIISLNKSDLLRVGKHASPYVGKFFSSMTGFHCKYNSKIKTTIHYKKPHYVIDLDETAIYYKKGSEYLENDNDNNDDELKGLNEYESMNILMEYIQQIFEGNDVRSVFLEKAINELKSKLKLLYEKAVGKKREDIVERFFTKESQILSNNKIIQESFYSFILNIFFVLYECYSEKGMNTMQNSLNNDNNDVNNENPEHKMYYLYYNDKNEYKKFAKEEKIFVNFFKASSKFASFYKNFIELDDISELYLIPMMFVEEFLNLKKQNNANINKIKFLDVIDNFNPQYKFSSINISLKKSDNTNTNQHVTLYDLFTELIDFRNFYAHYELHMKDKIFNELFNHSNISCFKLNTGINIYRYNSIELSNHLIQTYAYFLSNYSKEKLIEIFPSLEIKQQNIIPLINANTVSKTIEQYLIKNNILSTQDLLVFSILNIIGVYIEIIQSVKDAEHVGELLRECQYCMRKYLLMLTKYLYRITYNKYHNGIKNNTNYDISNELIYFQILFNSLQTNNEIPTKQLNIIANDFNKLSKEFEQSKVNAININNQHNNDIEIHKDEEKQETQSKYRSKIILMNYKCECKNKELQYNDDFFYNLSKNIGIKKNISYPCETCDTQITPQLKYIHDDIFIWDLYSPSKLYEQSSQIMDKYEKENDNSKLNKDICKGTILNLFYYATIIPNFKFSTCDMLLRLFNTLNE